MSEIDWQQSFYRVKEAFQKLKSMTKKIPASTWTPEYRELAEEIHTIGR